MNHLAGSLALCPVELILNRLLENDAHATRQLNAFTGKSLQVITRTPSFAVTLLFEPGQLRLRAVTAGATATDADATIEGRTRDLLNLLTQQPESRPLANPAIRLSGDAGLIQDLHAMLHAADIHWEDHLAPWLGDVVTNELGKFTADAQGWVRSARSGMKRNIDDYIKEEARLAPRPEQVAEFSDELDRLKLRIDRLKARTDLLQQKLTQGSAP